jgi:hypothetical protein
MASPPARILDRARPVQGEHLMAQTTLAGFERLIAASAWPIEAEASGVSSKLANAVSSGCPISATTVSRTMLGTTGGAASWSRASSAWYFGGSRSLRVERICPSLMTVVPSSSSAIRRCAGLACALLVHTHHARAQSECEAPQPGKPHTPVQSRWMLTQVLPTVPWHDPHDKCKDPCDEQPPDWGLQWPSQGYRRCSGDLTHLRAAPLTGHAVSAASPS